MVNDINWSDNWQQELIGKQDYFEKGIAANEEDNQEMLKSLVSTNLELYNNKEGFLKGFGADLQKRFPNGGWRTINGSHVFVNGGKVVAGLGGFNKHTNYYLQ